MMRVRTPSARRRLALAAIALWLGGVEALPALHEALHARLAPHRHDGGAMVVVSFEETTHRHPDGTVHYVAPRVAQRPRSASLRRSPEPPELRFDAVDIGHADHRADGLAHHAAALAPAAPPVTRPLPVDRRPVLVVVASWTRPVACPTVPAAARGPPITA